MRLQRECAKLGELLRIANVNLDALHESWRIVLGLLGLAVDCGDAWRERIAQLVETECAVVAYGKARADVTREASKHGRDSGWREVSEAIGQRVVAFERLCAIADERARS